MADITMCKGCKGSINCPVRELCYRYTAKASKLGQSYFMDIPFDGTTCTYYWGEDKENVFKKAFSDYLDSLEIDEVND